MRYPYLFVIHVIVFVCCLLPLHALTQQEEELKQRIAAAMNAVNHDHYSVGSEFDEIKYLPYFVRYLVSGNQLVLKRILNNIQLDHSLQSLGMLTAVLNNKESYQIRRETAIALITDYSPHELRGLGGHELRDGLLVTIAEDRGKAEAFLLLSAFADDAAVIEMLKAKRARYPHGVVIGEVGLSVPLTLCCDLVLAQAGDQDATARVVQVMRKRMERDQIAFILNNLQYLSSPVIAKTCATFLTDRRVAVTILYTDNGPGAYLRVCDAAIEVLSTRYNIDVGIDIAQRRKQYAPMPRYTDQEIATAGTRITAFLQKLPDTRQEPLAETDPTLREIEAVIAKVATDGDETHLAPLLPRATALVPYLIRYINNPSPTIRHAVVTLTKAAEESVLTDSIITAIANYPVAQQQTIGEDQEE